MVDLTKRQIESLAYVMQFLYELGFDPHTIKRAADAWWKVKAGSSTDGVRAPDCVKDDPRYECGCLQCRATRGVPSGHRICGVCGGQIPRGFPWPFWKDGKPVHSQCAAGVASGSTMARETRNSTPLRPDCGEDHGDKRSGNGKG